MDIYIPAAVEQRHLQPEVVNLSDCYGNERILVVDDMPEQRDIARKMLEKLGYTVTSAASGEEAVAAIDRMEVDLLVLDMIMPPGIDGLETYRRIIARHPGLRAIITSGYSASERVTALQEMGAGAYVRKPYSIEAIACAVRQELDRI